MVTNAPCPAQVQVLLPEPVAGLGGGSRLLLALSEALAAQRSGRLPAWLLVQEVRVGESQVLVHSPQRQLEGL